MLENYPVMQALPYEIHELDEALQKVITEMN